MSNAPWNPLSSFCSADANKGIASYRACSVASRENLSALSWPCFCDFAADFVAFLLEIDPNIAAPAIAVAMPLISHLGLISLLILLDSSLLFPHLPQCQSR